MAAAVKVLVLLAMRNPASAVSGVAVARSATPAAALTSSSRSGASRWRIRPGMLADPRTASSTRLRSCAVTSGTTVVSGSAGVVAVSLLAVAMTVAVASVGSIGSPAHARDRDHGEQGDRECGCTEVHGGPEALIGVTAQGAGESDEEWERDPDADRGGDLGGVS